MSFVVAGLASLATSGNLIIAYSALGTPNRPGPPDREHLDVGNARSGDRAWGRAVADDRGLYMYAAGSNAEAARLAGRSGAADQADNVRDQRQPPPSPASSTRPGYSARRPRTAKRRYVHRTGRHRGRRHQHRGGEGAIVAYRRWHPVHCADRQRFRAAGPQPAVRANHPGRHPAHSGGRRRMVPAPYPARRRGRTRTPGPRTSSV